MCVCVCVNNHSSDVAGFGHSNVSQKNHVPLSSRVCIGAWGSRIVAVGHLTHWNSSWLHDGHSKAGLKFTVQSFYRGLVKGQAESKSLKATKANAAAPQWVRAKVRRVQETVNWGICQALVMRPCEGQRTSMSVSSCSHIETVTCVESGVQNTGIQCSWTGTRATMHS